MNYLEPRPPVRTRENKYSLIAVKARISMRALSSCALVKRQRSQAGQIVSAVFVRICC